MRGRLKKMSLISSTPQSLSRLTIAMAGIQICYAAQFNLITPHLLSLGLPSHLVSLAWLAAPLSGLIVQPLIGLASDSCTSSLGRRRPFLICGALLTAFSMCFLANAHVISPILAAYLRINYANLSLCLTLCAFVGLDFSIQAVQAPLRALVTDVLPPAKFSQGNSYIAMFTGIGNLSGSLLVALHLSSHIKQWFHFSVSDVQTVFLISALLLLACVSITCFSIPEKPHRRENVSILSQLSSVRKSQFGPFLSPSRPSFFFILTRIPRPFWHVFAVQLCTWSGFFTLFVFLNSWVGTNIFTGDPSAAEGTPLRDLYDQGVRLGGIANASMAIVTVLYSMALPSLLKSFGVLFMYTFSQVVQSFVLIFAFFLRSTSAPSLYLKALVVADISAFGIVWATTVSLPWTLVARALNSDPLYAQHFGLFTTLFNASQSFPQLMVSLLAPLVMKIRNDPAIIMLIGGLLGLLGATLVKYLRIDTEKVELKGNSLAGLKSGELSTA